MDLIRVREVSKIMIVEVMENDKIRGERERKRKGEGRGLLINTSRDPVRK